MKYVPQTPKNPWKLEDKEELPCWTQKLQVIERYNLYELYENQANLQEPQEDKNG